MGRNFTNLFRPTSTTGAVNNVATSITVEDPTGIPAVDFTIEVDYDVPASREIMLVTAVVDNGDGTYTFTVTRGYDGTSAAAHPAGAHVWHVATAQDFQAAHDHIADLVNPHGVDAIQAGALPDTGGHLTGNVTLDPGVLIDGVDLSAFKSDFDTYDHTLENLSNVTVSSPAFGALLRYDGGGQWVDSGVTINASDDVLGVKSLTMSGLLHVNLSVADRVALFESGDTNAWIAFKDSTTTDDTAVMVGATGDDLKLLAGGGTRVTVGSTGDVAFSGALSGITSLTTSGDLTVGGSGIFQRDSLAALLVEETGATTPLGSILRLKTADYEWRLNNTYQTSDNHFVIRDQTAGVNRLTINTSGQTTITSATNVGFIVNKSNAGWQVYQTGDSSFTRFVVGGVEKGVVGYDALDDVISLTRSLAGTDGILIDSTGNVGIGTDNPLGDLHVLNAGADKVNVIFASDTAQGHLQVFSATHTTAHFADRFAVIANGNNASGLDLRADWASGDIRFYTGGNATSNERVRITSSGFVGIGTASPGSKLQVIGTDAGGTLDAASDVLFSIANNGASGLDAAMLLSSRSNGHSTIYFGENADGDRGRIRYDNSLEGAGDELSFWTNTTRQATITSTGSVGIATPSPSDLFHVYDSDSTKALRVGDTSLYAQLFRNKLKATGAVTWTVENAHASGVLDLVAASGVKVNNNLIFHEGHYPTWSEIDSKPSEFNPSSTRSGDFDITGTLDVNTSGSVARTTGGPILTLDGSGSHGLSAYSGAGQGTNLIFHSGGGGSISYTPDSGLTFPWYVNNNGDMYFSGTLQAGTVPWGRLSSIPSYASRWPSWTEVTSKPSTFAPSSHTHDWSDVTGEPVYTTRWPTKSEVGLGSVSNYGVASQAEAEAGSVNNHYMTPLRTSQAISALASGGAWELISTSTITAATTNIIFTGLSSAYRRYVVVISGLKHSSGGSLVHLRMELSTDNGSTWLTSGYGSLAWDIGSNATPAATSSSSNIHLTNNASYGSYGGYNGTIYLHNLAQSSVQSTIISHHIASTSSVPQWGGAAANTGQTATAHNAVKFYAFSDFTEGVVCLYAIKE